MTSEANINIVNSSDLWVAGDVGTTTDSGKAVTLSYAVGTAKGDVNYADVQFHDHTIKDQAYRTLL